MKRLLLLGLALGSAAVAREDDATLRRFLDYRKLPRVTDQQIDVEASVRMLCIDPKTIYGPHLKPGLHLYANPKALDAKTRQPSAAYPVGSLIVKEKFETKGGTTPSIITVMEKVANKGRVDDWQFYMVRLSDRSFVKDEGKTSCTDCHSRYTKTDFISPQTDRLVTAFTQKSGQAPAPAR